MRIFFFIALFAFIIPAYAAELPAPLAAPLTTAGQKPAPDADGADAAPPVTDNSEDFQVDEPEEDATTATQGEPEPAAPPENLHPLQVDKSKKLDMTVKTMPPAATPKGPADEDADDEIADFEENNPKKNYTNLATLQGLNKITARASTLSVAVGNSIRFGNLEIFVRLCWKSSPEEAPDSKALLDIWEQKPDEDKKQIFYGWMFASSPALSALEHPVYDITVLECKHTESK